jgi:hypothetical protein
VAVEVEEVARGLLLLALAVARRADPDEPPDRGEAAHDGERAPHEVDGVHAPQARRATGGTVTTCAF